MSKATHELTNMVIKEISLVPDGDNPEAHVLIAKRRAPAAAGDTASRIAAIVKGLEAAVAAGGASAEAVEAAVFLKNLGGNMDEIEKKLAEIEKSLGAVTARAEAAETALADMTKDRDDARTELAKAKGEGESEEEMLKGLPAPMRALLEKSRNEASLATAAVEKLTKDRETAEFITKARDVAIGDADALGGLFYRVAKGATTAADVDVLEGVLKAAAAVQAPLFQPKGKTTNVSKSGDVEVILKAKQEEILKAEPTLTKEAAYTKALDQNPELYDQYLAGRR